MRKPGTARAPTPSTPATIQNRPAVPVTAPMEPNSSGMAKLDAFMVSERSAIASPWRAGGATSCSSDSTIGCTAPSVKPSSVEHSAMPIGPCVHG